LAAALIILFSTSSVAQIGAIVLGGIVGQWLCRSGPATPSGHVQMPVSRKAGLIALIVFFLLLAGLPVLRGPIGSSGVALFEAFYRPARSSSAAGTSSCLCCARPS
jgi:chromate transporter